jgi:hypothetical protein
MPKHENGGAQSARGVRGRPTFGSGGPSRKYTGIGCISHSCNARPDRVKYRGCVLKLNNQKTDREAAMHKYAAVTTLAIALNIMMVALTVSASPTPANARGWFCDNVVCLCQSKCPRSGAGIAPSQVLSCIASCGRMEGVEHLSPSELRARFGAAKKPAQH